jgi:hypothetical protein
MQQPTGWQTRSSTLKGKPAAGQAAPPAEEIVSIGKAPWQVVEADIAITLANPGLAKLHVLDANLQEVSASDLKREGGKVSFAFPKDALYAVLTK